MRCVQEGPDAILPTEGIDWPSAEELGAAIRRFKARGKTRHESSLSKRPADPAGYLVDAEAALAYGLVDHVFPYAGTPLKGDRLNVMMQWLEMHEQTFPRAAVRERVAKLRSRLAIRDSWQQDDYEAAVRSHGFSTKPPTDDTWRWCSPSLRWGRGGYSCALWVLLHTTLANTYRQNAQATLSAMMLWVNDFFGCEECARHFVQYFEVRENSDLDLSAFFLRVATCSFLLMCYLLLTLCDRRTAVRRSVEGTLAQSYGCGVPIML